MSYATSISDRATARLQARPGPQGRNVVLASSALQWGGGEEQMRVLARGLRDRGHRVTILARRDGALACRLEAEDFDVVRFAGRGRNPSALLQIRRSLKRLQADVLHYNASHAMIAAGIAAVGLSIPARIAARRVAFPIRSPWCYRLLADRVICVSHAVAEMSSSRGIPKDRLRVIHDGVDPDRVRSGDRGRGRRTLRVDDRQSVLLTVARLADCKGHSYLLDALPRVVKRHPGMMAVIVGDGELSESLRAYARQLGLDQRVRFLGYRSDIPDLIQASDLFVLPSLVEGLCSTLIDAMLAGRPIVTTTAGGIPELTNTLPAEEPVAWSVPPCDRDALASAILDALDRPEQAAALADRARCRAERLFTADRMVEATLGVYDELIAAATARHGSRIINRQSVVSRSLGGTRANS